jgi:hypothetical protein
MLSQAQRFADVELAAASPDAATADSEASRCLLAAATCPPKEPGAADEGGQFTACEASIFSAGRLLGTVKAGDNADVPIGPHIVLEGFVFRTLHGHEPESRHLINEHEKFVEIPSGYELCPHDEVSIRACREHPWQAQYLVFADGIPRFSAAAAPTCTPGGTGGSPPNLKRRGSAIAAVTNGNTWTFDVFIRKRQ